MNNTIESNLIAYLNKHKLQLLGGSAAIAISTLNTKKITNADGKSFLKFLDMEYNPTYTYYEIEAYCLDRKDNHIWVTFNPYFDAMAWDSVQLPLFYQSILNYALNK
jgi:hypothetical protein